MKNKKNKIAGGGQTEKTKRENDKNELSEEKILKMKIAVKTYQEPACAYFSSPCMLSEMEDTEDTFNF